MLLRDTLRQHRANTDYSNKRVVIGHACGNKQPHRDCLSCCCTLPQAGDAVDGEISSTCLQIVSVKSPSLMFLPFPCTYTCLFACSTGGEHGSLLDKLRFLWTRTQLLLFVLRCLSKNFHAAKSYLTQTDKLGHAKKEKVGTRHMWCLDDVVHLPATCLAGWCMGKIFLDKCLEGHCHEKTLEKSWPKLTAPNRLAIGSTTLY